MSTFDTKILIIDDHNLIRRALCNMIEVVKGFKVVAEADNGLEIDRLITKHRPDIVVMDIGMKGLNGIDACQWITQNYEKVRVLALSAYCEATHVCQMMKAGAAGFVPKDAAGEELALALRAIARGEIYLSPQVARYVIDQRGYAQPLEADALGKRERQVLQLLAEGHTSGEIGTLLHIATGTVETHRRNIMKKLDIHSVAELTKFAVREGITQLD